MKTELYKARKARNSYRQKANYYKKKYTKLLAKYGLLKNETESFDKTTFELIQSANTEVLRLMNEIDQYKVSMWITNIGSICLGAAIMRIINYYS